MAKKGNHPANQRNPNNSAYKAAQGNRDNQLNPNNPAYHSSRRGNQPGLQGKSRKSDLEAPDDPEPLLRGFGSHQDLIFFCG